MPRRTMRLLSWSDRASFRAPGVLVGHFSELGDLHPKLAPDELARAHDAKFVARRMFQRQLAGASNLEWSPVGQPILTEGGFVSFAACEDWTVAARSDEFPVGIDIELPSRATATLSELSQDRNFFGPDEEDSLRAWTLKEACAKALGIGIGHGTAWCDTSRIADGRLHTQKGDFRVESHPFEGGWISVAEWIG